MAVLSGADLKIMRQGAAADVVPVTWTKAQAKLALQAVEDYYQATAKAGFGAAIETAVPGVFSNPAKKTLGRYYFQHRFGSGG